MEQTEFDHLISIIAERDPAEAALLVEEWQRWQAAEQELAGLIDPRADTWGLPDSQRLNRRDRARWTEIVHQRQTAFEMLRAVVGPTTAE
jgi:hypothetical protein